MSPALDLRPRRPLVGLRRAVTALCLSLGVFATGCADGDGGALVIAGVPVPDMNCFITPTANAFRSRGALELSERLSYILPLVVTNNLDPDIDDVRPISAGSFDVSLRGAEVDIVDPAGRLLAFDGQPNPFTVPVAGFVATGGAAAISFPVIPGTYGDGLRPFLSDGGTFVTRVRLFGRTAGGSEVDTPPFTFVVEAFDNTASCEAYCAAGEDPAAFVGTATSRCAVGEEEAAPTCIPGQDDLAVLDPACGECGGAGRNCVCSCF